jgi:hypothetical protein
MMSRWASKSLASWRFARLLFFFIISVVFLLAPLHYTT